MEKNIQFEKRLSTDKMLPLILKMSLPAVAAQLVNLLYGIVDRIYIGHIPKIGTNALAGMGVTNSIIILISAFGMFIGGGGAPLATMALGQNNRQRAEKILSNGLTILVIFTIVTTSIVYIFMKPILFLIGASDQTICYAVDYLTIYLLGSFFVMISIGLNPFISAQGRPATAMISVIIGAVMNIALDPLFIFTFHLGVRGAAIATVISQTCSAIWILKFLFSKKASLRLSISNMKPDFKIIRSVLALGVSPFIMSCTESLIGFVLNGTLKKYGDIYISSLTVMQSAMMFTGTPVNGFTQGFSPIISYNYGHGNSKRIKECFKITLAIVGIFNLVTTLFMIAFPHLIASVFTKDPVLIRTVSHVMPRFLLGMTIFGLQRECQSVFVALGQAKISLFIALLRKVFLLIPLAIVLQIPFGVMGVFMGEAISDATAALICTSIFLYKFPKILKQIKLTKIETEKLT